jgi:hypothetical protein
VCLAQTWSYRMMKFCMKSYHFDTVVSIPSYLGRSQVKFSVWRPFITAEIFCALPQSLQTSARILPFIDHIYYLPWPSKFIIHNHFPIWYYITYAFGEVFVNKPRIKKIHAYGVTRTGTQFSPE